MDESIPLLNDDFLQFSSLLSYSTEAVLVILCSTVPKKTKENIATALHSGFLLFMISFLDI